MAQTPNQTKGAGGSTRRPLRALVEAHREEIEAVAARHKGKRVRVFGSVARGDERPESDIDFLVDYEKGSSLFDRGHIMDELEALLEIIGESARAMSQEYRARYPGTPWSEIIRLRTLLVHQGLGLIVLAAFAWGSSWEAEEGQCSSASTSRRCSARRARSPREADSASARSAWRSQRGPSLLGQFRGELRDSVSVLAPDSTAATAMPSSTCSG